MTRLCLDCRASAVFFAFAACMPAANWLIGNVGTVCVPSGPCLIPVAPGLLAPSGVLVIGLALVLRDLLHEIAGLRAVFAALVVGAALSYLTSPPMLALASAVAFFLAELADLAVYAPLRRRRLALAVLASGLVGAAVDSALFVWLAFGSLDFSIGTWIGKIYASALAVAVLLLIKERRHENA